MTRLGEAGTRPPSSESTIVGTIQSATRGNPLLSIIVPVFNEEDSVGPLCEAIIAAVEPLGLEFEILFVDDGSRDGTLARADAEADSRVRVIKLRRNYGQTPAMAAGIDTARGEILITMDGDLQNDPADIPRFIEKINEGYQLVVGWRRRRQDKYFSRVLPSMIANRLISKVTGIAVKDNGCSLKAYRADLIKKTPFYNEMHRFIPAMMSLGGARMAELEVRHHPRKFGTSKYGISRIYKVLLDLLLIKTILTFFERPFLWVSSLTMLSAGLSLFFLLMTVLDGPETRGIGFLGMSMLFGMLTIFLLFLGYLANLIFKTGKTRTAHYVRVAAQTTVTAPRDDIKDQP